MTITVNGNRILMFVSYEEQNKNSLMIKLQVKDLILKDVNHEAEIIVKCSKPPTLTDVLKDLNTVKLRSIQRYHSNIIFTVKPV